MNKSKTIQYIPVLMLILGLILILTLVGAIISNEFFKQDYSELQAESCGVENHQFNKTELDHFVFNWDGDITKRVNGIFECEKCRHLCIVRFDLIDSTYVPVDTTDINLE
jgi:hypothetical protein